MCCFLLRHRTRNLISCLSRATVYFCLHLAFALKTARSVYAQCSLALGAGSSPGFKIQEKGCSPVADYDQIVDKICDVICHVTIFKIQYC